jgi:hypothetical protein
MIPAYPLQWPTGWPRTAASALQRGRFGTRKKSAGSSWATMANLTVAQARDRVLDELERMGIHHQNVVISTNLELRRDGFPRSDRRAPADPGAAVYWQARNGDRRVMAIDQYHKVEDNLAAIAATLDAMRAIERHGGARVLERAFTGFTALPAPAAAKNWREVFGFAQATQVSRELLRDRYRKLASARHPDRPGGSDVAMSELNVALAEAEKEVGNG